MSIIQIKIDEEVIHCKFFYETAPLTCRAIVQLLPFEGELHYAKIAGEEIFFGIPFILPLEHATEVRELAPGTIAYWPFRQVFCIYYGPPQEEAATVTVFAKVTKNLQGLRRVGESVRMKQGKRVLVEIAPSSYQEEEP